MHWHMALNLQRYLQGQANFVYYGDLFEISSSWTFYCDCIRNFRNIWGKPDFTPENIFNQAVLVRDEL